jgi:hypothetical protein
MKRGEGEEVLAVRLARRVRGEESEVGFKSEKEV